MTTNQITNDKFVLLVVGEVPKRKQRLITLLHEKYGDKLEIVNQCEFEEIQGRDIDFMIIDEIYPSTVQTMVAYNPKPQESPYWQRGRW